MTKLLPNDPGKYPMRLNDKVVFDVQDFGDGGSFAVARILDEKTLRVRTINLSRAATGLASAVEVLSLIGAEQNL
ncbi:MAG: hypothetical protein D6775_08110, partial [Caldilineae bacterium]